MGDQIFMICKDFREVVKRFRQNHKYLSPWYGVAGDQDIAFQKYPGALFPEVIEKLPRKYENTKNILKFRAFILSCFRDCF